MMTGNVQASQTERNFSLKKNREEIDCLKQMYRYRMMMTMMTTMMNMMIMMMTTATIMMMMMNRLAREMKIFRVDTVLKNIVEEGFNAACQVQ